MQNMKLDVGTDGIAVLALDIEGAPMNTLSSPVVRELSETLDYVISRADIRGLVITSAKPVFAAGWDLTDLLCILEQEQSLRETFARTREYGDFLRRLETCGKPVAAAINGLALGGGLELALACHYRVLADDARATVGLPEVKVGLLPGAGGTQRLPRLMGMTKALPLLLEGTHLKPAEALQLGVVDEIAPVAQVVDRARERLLSGLEACAPWDRKDFRVPGGSQLTVPAISMTLMAATAIVTKNTLRNLPAPMAILSAVFEGLQVSLATGLKIEGKYFAKLLRDPAARNLVRTLFVNKGAAERLVRRPAHVPKLSVSRLGVLGAGMMGTGIAHVSAAAGIECVLLDSTRELAEKGKAQVAKELLKKVEKGRMRQADADQLLNRIQATDCYPDLAGCDLVVEAVFEDRDIKARVTRDAEAVLSSSAIFASNTSTLPISGLAQAAARPDQFIGVHFFSPVDRMPLVEVIVGRRTSEETLARALDYVAQLRKTPIVVRDSRGFYTSRIFGTYCSEGWRMLEEGIHPALIESAGRFAGMPVGPLAVSDEVSLELQYKVIRQTRQDLGEWYHYPVGWNVVRHLVEDLGRLGRKSGGGFYEYGEGTQKQLWPGLIHQYPAAPVQPSMDDLKTRLLHIQALETVRCLEEGVLNSPADADLGAVLGWGFPAYTGGTLSWIDTVGIERFVADCHRLARLYGPRFEPTPGLILRERTGERFHRPAS